METYVTIDTLCFTDGFFMNNIVKIVDSGLDFYFSSFTLFYFLFLEQLRLGLIGHAVTSVTT